MGKFKGRSLHKPYLSEVVRSLDGRNSQQKAAYSDYPSEVKHAILLKVADLYEHRGGDEGFDKNINDAIESILWPDRVDLL
jgi:hypothetical protein